MTDEPQVSPVSTKPPHPFPHQATNVAPPKHSAIDASQPAVNAGSAAELDSTPVSSTAGKTGERKSGASPDDEERVYGELSGEKGVQAREKRAALLERRSRDPGVMVDIPKEPSADEYLEAEDEEARERRSKEAGEKNEESK